MCVMTCACCATAEYLSDDERSVLRGIHDIAEHVRAQQVSGLAVLARKGEDVAFVRRYGSSQRMPGDAAMLIVARYAWPESQ